MPFHPSGRCSERNVRMRSPERLGLGCVRRVHDPEPTGCRRFSRCRCPNQRCAMRVLRHRRVAPHHRGRRGRTRCPPREVEPSRRIDLRLRGSKEDVAEPEGDRAGHARQPEVEQVRHRCHGLTHELSRTDADGLIGASAAGRPVIAAIAVPDASASRHPWPPHAQRRPPGTTTTWPMWPALEPRRRADARRGRCLRRRRSTRPWPGSRARLAPLRPIPPPAPAPWRRCRR